MAVRRTAPFPAPLVAADVDLRDFAFMPLDLLRLRRSKGWLIAKKNPEIGFYMLNLWAASWHEVPAASLEDDDDILADAALCAPLRWSEIKGEALRGWTKCSDGRLYHNVVAEKAAEAWKRKCEQRGRTEAARRARLEKRGGDPTLSVTSGVTKSATGVDTGNVTKSVTDINTDNVTTSVTNNVTASKGQGQGDIGDSSLRSESMSSLLRSSDSSISEKSASVVAEKKPSKQKSQSLRSPEFEKTYGPYPRHVQPEAAAKAFHAAVAMGVDPGKIAAASARFGAAHRHAGTEKRFIPHMATWLNAGGFDDEDLPTPPTHAGSSGKPRVQNPHLASYLEDHGLNPNGTSHDLLGRTTIDLADGAAPSAGWGAEEVELPGIEHAERESDRSSVASIGISKRG